MINEYGAEYDFRKGFSKPYCINFPDLPKIIKIEDGIQISVIIPNYNRSERLPLILHNLCKIQKFPKNSLEIIIIDDVSIDNSIKVLRKLIEKYNDYYIKVIPLSDSRCFQMGHTTNVGVKRALGNIIMFNQPDEIMFNDDFLLEHYKLHQIKNNAWCMSCVGVTFYQDSEKIMKILYDTDKKRRENIKKYMKIKKAHNQYFPNLDCSSVKKEHVLKIHGFNENIKGQMDGIDTDFRLRIERKGVVCCFNKELLVIHLGHNYEKHLHSNYKEKYMNVGGKYMDFEVDKNEWGEITESEENNIFKTKRYD